jgi:hypothetical protein
MGVLNQHNLGPLVLELAAKDAIKEVIYRYSHGIDRRDWKVLNDVFWPDSRLEYGLYNDTGAGFAAIIKQVYGDLKVDVTQHFIGNCILRVDGDKAIGETYVRAFHRVPKAAGGGYEEVIMGARYLDNFERRGDEWRISVRKVVFDWFRVNPDSTGWEEGYFGINAATAHTGKPGMVERAEFTALMRG